MGKARRTAMCYKKLGIPLESRDYGKLVLTQWSPETDEIFILREKVIPASRIFQAQAVYRLREVPEKLHMLHLLRLEKGGESMLGYANYLPAGRGVYVDYLYTKEAHRRRDIASSLLSYIKTHGKDIVLSAGQAAEHFYKGLGFVESERYMDRELPAGKPLPKRWFEGKARKFLILPRKRGRLRL